MKTKCAPYSRSTSYSGQTSADKVNIIYFVPKDSEPVPGYSSRLATILNHGQNYFSQWMERWGYGELTFRLNKDESNRAKIILIKGEKTKDFYVYDITGEHGVDNQIKYEVNRYFDSHPQDKAGSYNLIIMPARTPPSLAPGNASSYHGGVPFYGSSKWTFAMDYPGLDYNNLGKDSDESKLAAYCIGGMLHELGHGIDLYHNAGRSDEILKLGEGLMGYGCMYYVNKPSYLSSADAAILSVNPAVSPQKRSDWHVNPNFSLPRVTIVINDKGISLSGRFTTDKTVKAITVNFNQLVNGSINHDDLQQGYRSVGLGERYENASGDGKFNILMPMQGLYNGQWLDGENYRVALRFCHENGAIVKRSIDISLYRGMNESRTLENTAYAGLEKLCRNNLYML